jgi:hypothetical protein
VEVTAASVTPEATAATVITASKTRKKRRREWDYA